MLLDTLKKHWPEYLIEAVLLGIFMLSACGFGVLLEHPNSPVRQMLSDAFTRRVWMGLAMGLTAIGLIYSPWGQQSGAHFNPAVTLTFWRLGKISGVDAFGYGLFQFVGGVMGVWFASVIWQANLSHPTVNYVATLPGSHGVKVAFIAEAVISFIQMTLVLNVSSASNIARYTGLLAGAFVALYISFEAPLSGMSMNPARTFGSAFSGNLWTGWWIYITAPPLGMLAAAQVHMWQKRQVACAKLHHQNNKRCIHCGAPGAAAMLGNAAFEQSPN